MLRVLSGIIDGITSIVGVIQSVVSTLLGFFQMVPAGVALLTSLITSLPAVLITFATASVALCVVLFVIGR